MMREHWDAGARDMRVTIAHPEWLQRATENGVTTFDLAEPGRGRGRHLPPRLPAPLTVHQAAQAPA